MNRKKNVQKKQQPANRGRAVRRNPSPGPLRMSLEGAALASYHAALSDPFASPGAPIPSDVRPETHVVKVFKRVMATACAGAIIDYKGNTHHDNNIELKHKSSGVWVVDWVIPAGVSNRRSRIVGAAIRLTTGDTTDNLGGFVTCSNAHSQRGDYEETSRFGREKTAFFKPVFSDDYEWRSGQGADDAEMDNLSRAVKLTLDHAVAAMVDFAVIYEVDGPAAVTQVHSSNEFISSGRVGSYDTGPHGKNVGRLTKYVERPSHAHDSAATNRHALLGKHLTKGLELATEVGATAMVAPAAIQKASGFARALMYGEEAVVGAAEAASAAMPLLLMA